MKKAEIQSQSNSISEVTALGGARMPPSNTKGLLHARYRIKKQNFREANLA